MVGAFTGRAAHGGGHLYKVPTVMDLASNSQKRLAPDELGQQPVKKPIVTPAKKEDITEWLRGLKNQREKA